MLDSCTTAQERWGGVNQLIDRWLAERKQLILQYSTLRDRATPVEQPDQALDSFCDVLVDYVSAGHFEVYEQLMREAEAFNDTRGLELARQVYPRIETITQSAVAFNDAYGEANAELDEAAMQAELRMLGAFLHERFELEDCLIEVLHNAHQDLIAANEPQGALT
ncbi:sigma D regulator [Pseudomonas sp.]|jgi:regulator of sigma D|uniref:sigma D regulator n=1 Tax=Pseudomonas sp. TaxID=306 RepID=UPI00272C76B7|nr:sigma D regulator [Pseudomonas sp.]